MFVNVELDIPASSILQLKESSDSASRPHEGIQKIIKLLEAIQGGMLDASVKVAIRDVTAAVASAGAGAPAAVTYNLK